jgi:hypothetical protein
VLGITLVAGMTVVVLGVTVAAGIGAGAGVGVGAGIGATGTVVVGAIGAVGMLYDARRKPNRPVLYVVAGIGDMVVTVPGVGVVVTVPSLMTIGEAEVEPNMRRKNPTRPVEVVVPLGIAW